MKLDDRNFLHLLGSSQKLALKSQQSEEKEINNIFLSKTDNVKKSSLDDFSDTEFISLMQKEIGSNYNLKDLPDGVSKFEYKDARYTIYKKDDKYSSEFYCPSSVSKGEFFNNFSNLKPAENKTATTNFDIDSINGELDETTLQGSTGDCWILTALNSLNSSEKGKEIIKNAIKVNDDNTVTVTFAGLGVSYTLSADEIAKYDTDNNLNDSYSNGDNDMLAFELAAEKLVKDIVKGEVKVNTGNENIDDIASDIDDGGLPSQMIYFLTGVEAEEYYNDDLSNLDSKTVYSVLEDALENGSTSITFGIYNNEHTATLTDGSTYSLDVGDGGHALAVTNITSDTVTFVNPWDSSVEYTMSWSEFANLGIGYIASGDLSKSVEVNEDEIVDKTDDEDEEDIIIEPFQPKDDIHINPNDDNYDKPNDSYSNIGGNSDISKIFEIISSLLEWISSLFSGYLSGNNSKM